MNPEAEGSPHEENYSIRERARAEASTLIDQGHVPQAVTKLKQQFAAPLIEYADRVGVLEYGRALFWAGKPVEARRQLHRVLASQPTDNWALSFLGQVELSLGNRDEATGLFQEALQFNTDNHEAKLFLGENPEALVGEATRIAQQDDISARDKIRFRELIAAVDYIRGPEHIGDVTQLPQEEMRQIVATQKEDRERTLARERAAAEDFSVHFLFEPHDASTKSDRKAVVNRLVTEMEKSFVRGETNIFVPEDASGVHDAWIESYHEALARFGSHEMAFAFLNGIANRDTEVEEKDVRRYRRILFNPRRLAKAIKNQYPESAELVTAFLGYVSAQYTALDKLKDKGYDIAIRPEKVTHREAGISEISVQEEFTSYDDFKTYFVTFIDDARERDKGLVEQLGEIAEEHTDPTHVFVLRGTAHHTILEKLPKYMQPRSSSTINAPYEKTPFKEFLWNAIAGKEPTEDAWKQAFADIQNE